MQEDLVFRNPLNEGYIIISSVVLRLTNRHRQITSNAHEAGGILLGERRGRHIEVTFATTPKRGDKSSRTGFHRRSPFHQRFATRNWRRLGGKLDYVGEWHTHPELNPRPSTIDQKEWNKLIRTRKNGLVFMILGTSGLWLGFANCDAIAELSQA